MPSGGVREPTPGTTYTNRSDLAVKAAPGQTYGEAGAQVAAQQAVPLQGPSGPAPGSLTPLTAPTQRPGEPITAGLSTGPGPGPEALGIQNSLLAQLRAMYAQYPSRDLLRLIYAASP